MKARYLSLVLLSILAGVGGVQPVPAGAQASRPNILIIVTDDQRAMDTMQVLPLTQQWFGQGGTTYTNAYAATPVCCPARAQIMSGRFAHNNGVLKNVDSDKLAQESTLQALLQAAGYRTALVGKYLNAWPLPTAPPYFHRWHVIAPQADTYFGNEFNNNGTVEREPGYSTDVIRDYAIDVIQNDAGGKDEDPWLMYVTPFAPHHPWETAPRHIGTDVGTWPGNPAVFEEDKRDKPDYVRGQKRDLARALEIRDGQLHSLMAVDELVDQIFKALALENEQNTLAFFISDNGFMWAEHGLGAKNHPYTESIRVPMLARWPGHIQPGQTDDRFVANIDIAPTALGAAGVAPNPSYPPDGTSLLQASERSKILTEAWPGHANWASIRTRTYQYIEYYNSTTGALKRGNTEYYDLVKDPYQLNNLLGDDNPRNDPFVPPLSAELLAARSCVGEAACFAALAGPGVPSECTGPLGVAGHHLVGTAGADRMFGIKTRDVICGNAGRDVIRSQRGNDLVLGGDGSDVLWGSDGKDVLIGGGGRDRCIGGPDKDRFRSCEKSRL